MTILTERLERFLYRKKRWKEQLLLLRTGDLYESFGSDAETVARCLNDGVGSRDGRSWWGCEVGSLESALRRLTGAGYRVAVGDRIDGDDEVVEATGPLSPHNKVVEWATRPTKAESEEGHLMEVWTSRDRELRVRRVEPLSGGYGYFDAQALISESEDEDDWLEVGRDHRLSVVLMMAVAHFRKTAPVRANAIFEAVALIDHARSQGLSDFPESSAKSGGIELKNPTDRDRIPGAHLHEQPEGIMSSALTEAVEAGTETAVEVQEENKANLKLTEVEARNLAFELGWAMAAKDLPLNGKDSVLSRLNGVLTTTPLEDLSVPQSPDCRALFKRLQKMIKAQGVVEIVGDRETAVVEEKSKRKAKTTTKKTPSANGKASSEGPSNKERVYRLWEKKPTVDPQKCFEEVEEAVKLTTIRSWINQWKKGKALPACANK